jgi:hypothetical protein
MLYASDAMSKASGDQNLDRHKLLLEASGRQFTAYLDAGIRARLSSRACPAAPSQSRLSSHAYPIAPIQSRLSSRAYPVAPVRDASHYFVFVTRPHRSLRSYRVISSSVQPTLNAWRKANRISVAPSHFECTRIMSVTGKTISLPCISSRSRR